MGKSTTRVQQALIAAGISSPTKVLPGSTRTAQEAADACGCAVSQIVKSLIFEGSDSGDLYLLLVSGANEVDLPRFNRTIGESLERANPKTVRSRTGFAIGGVAPIGLLEQPKTFLDEALFEHETVWAAAGAPNAVFQITPDQLLTATTGTLFKA